MSLNKNVPDSLGSSFQVQNARPDYAQLVRFLVQPFLDSPESLSVHCEMSNNTSRAWIRLAFEAADKGRVYGRGGRNIQAIRTVIEAAAQAVGQSVHLDIYGSHAEGLVQESTSNDRFPERSVPPRRTSAPISAPKTRPQPRLN